MTAHRSNRGLSLIELMVSVLIFLIVSAAIVALMSQTQARYRGEQQTLDAFQEVRIGIGQLVREIHNAGFPASNTYTSLPTPPTSIYGSNPLPALAREFAVPFRGYVSTTYNQGCVINSNCTIPDGNDLSIEEDLDPYNTACPNQVEIIDYQLVADGNGTSSTLERRVSSKDPVYSTTTCLPDVAGGAQYVPLVENVINAYQSPAVPVFSYTCEDGTSSCTPEKIRQVAITLMVRSAQPDVQTQQVQVVTLRAIADRLNPSQ